jgi:hypothetical protein
MPDDEQRRLLLGIAESYDRLAARAEQQMAQRRR